MSTYEAMLRDLFGRSASGIKLGLGTMQALLQALGEPQQALALGFVVVAGTNGKGSTSLMIANALRCCGHRVGLYTSPHLLRFTERIRVDGEEITQSQALQLFAQVICAQQQAGVQPSFFEITTAMALLAFAQAAVDIAVLEVGLGGRLDATNVVAKRLSVITPIDFDHMEYLGGSLEAIAAEKGGIIAPGVPVVVAEQPPAALAVLRTIAAAQKAPFIAATAANDPSFAAGPASGVLDQDETPPPGAYQRINVATALAACAALDAMGISCPAAPARQAVLDSRWPGRYHKLITAPSVLLDGAHNPAGIAALLNAIALDPELLGKPLHAIFTALTTKDAAAMLTQLQSRLRSLQLCPTPSSRSRDMAQLARLLPPYHRHAAVQPNFTQALAAARQAAARDNGVVLITGSLFLVGEALAQLTKQRRDPPIDG